MQNSNINDINEIIESYKPSIKFFKSGKDLMFFLNEKLFCVNNESLNILSENISSSFKIEFIGASKTQIRYIINLLKEKNDFIPFIKHFPNKDKITFYNISEAVLLKREELSKYKEDIASLKDKERVISRKETKQLVKTKI